MGFFTREETRRAGRGLSVGRVAFGEQILVGRRALIMHLYENRERDSTVCADAEVIYEQFVS